MPKSPPKMGMGTLCTAKKPPIYRHGGTLYCQKVALYMGMGTLPKSPKNMGMGALCTSKKPQWGLWGVGYEHWP